MQNINGEHTQTSKNMLMLGALGVVFGDIGTSPLYALKECLKPFAKNGAIDSAVIFGICSLILWSIFVIVSLKYVLFVMKADNKGEGGILSLMSLANKSAPEKIKKAILVLGLVGAATFYGDSVITPAISVLSAVEGMELISPKLEHYVIPCAFGILLALFLIQKRGTSSVGKVFGPLMLIWFLSLGALGISQIIQNLEILKSINPYYAVSFVAANPSLAVVIAGSVFLAITGGEALYADMGHFGRSPINKAWFVLVFPCLVLNYLGQSALVLSTPNALDNPFYKMAPSLILPALVILATCATVIASQAVISGAFSMTKQAIQLGYLPRLNIVQTSEKEIGQIYLPFINWVLFIAVALLLVIFKSSDNLSAAYGIAVVTTMIVTTILMCVVAVYLWKWHWIKTAVFATVFLSVDALFLSSNILKIEEGGWIPLVLAALILFVMFTWKSGRNLVYAHIKEDSLDLKEFIPMIKQDSHMLTTHGSAVFLNSIPGKTPVSFMHNLKHNHVLHESIIFFSMCIKESPYSKEEKRFEICELSTGVYQVVAHLGFMETPDVPLLLKQLKGRAELKGWEYEELSTSFFLSRETIVSKKTKKLSSIQESTFAWMTKNSAKAADYFNIPSGRVVELGSQMNI